MQKAITIVAIACLLMLSIALAMREDRNRSTEEHKRLYPVFAKGPLTVANRTRAATVVKVSFGAASKVSTAQWAAFCKETSKLNCQFEVPAMGNLDLPLANRHLNATLSFDGSGCGATKAELDMNNPAWFDTYDVSLVDGYSNNIAIEVAPTNGVDGGVVTLGPPLGKDGNANVFGLFPYGCDICVARQQPPCGIPSGGSGCKAGTQYAPAVPCQYQGPQKGGGGVTVVVALVP